MSAELGQGRPGAPEAPAHESDVAHAAPLDADHNGVVTMSEIAPPRPESGHDVVNAVVAEGLLAGALVLTAAYTALRQRRGRRNPWIAEMAGAADTGGTAETPDTPDTPDAGEA